MSLARGMRRLFWVAVAVGILLVLVGLVEPRYVFAPLLGLAIWRFGTASLASLRHGGTAAEPEPAPVDPRVERTTFWCGGCGSELLLLVRGSPAPPRHCGERMHARTEVAHEALN